MAGAARASELGAVWIIIQGFAANFIFRGERFIWLPQGYLGEINFHEGLLSLPGVVALHSEALFGEQGDFVTISYLDFLCVAVHELSEISHGDVADFESAFSIGVF